MTATETTSISTKIAQCFINNYTKGLRILAITGVALAAIGYLGFCHHLPFHLSPAQCTILAGTGVGLTGTAFMVHHIWQVKTGAKKFTSDPLERSLFPVVEILFEKIAAWKKRRKKQTLASTSSSPTTTSGGSQGATSTTASSSGSSSPAQLNS